MLMHEGAVDDEEAEDEEGEGVAKPASTRAALGIEKGEPTCMKSVSWSTVSTTSIAPRSMLRSTIRYSFDGFTYTCNGGWPLISIARLMTFPPSIRQ